MPGDASCPSDCFKGTAQAKVPISYALQYCTDLEFKKEWDDVFNEGDLNLFCIANFSSTVIYVSLRSLRRFNTKKILVGLRLGVIHTIFYCEQNICRPAKLRQ